MSTIVAKLELVSEQKAAVIGGSSGHEKPESRPPVDLDELAKRISREVRTDTLRPPNKDRSIYRFYLWHFKRVKRIGDPRRRLRLAHIYVFLAERDLIDTLLGVPDRATDHARPTTKEIDDEILGYEGVDSLAVALITDHSPVQIEALRRLHGRDKRTGYKREDELSPAQRADKARELKREKPHLSARQIGAQLGVSHVAVLRYLGDEDALAA